MEGGIKDEPKKTSSKYDVAADDRGFGSHFTHFDETGVTFQAAYTVSCQTLSLRELIAQPPSQDHGEFYVPPQARMGSDASPYPRNCNDFCRTSPSCHSLR